MTAVIRFPEGRVRPTPEARPETTAEIIIFPGVRIERLALDLAERKPAKCRGSTRAVHAAEVDFY